MESNEGGCSSYYGVLGVSVDSSDDQIRRAYRKLAMVCFCFLVLSSFFRKMLITDNVDLSFHVGLRAYVM